MTPLDLTKPVQTRDGRPVRILCTDAPGIQPVIGFIGPSESIERWDLDGTYSPGYPFTKTDLVNAPERFSFKEWANVFRNGYGGFELGVTGTRECCDKAAGAAQPNPTRITCIEVTISGQVGDGLEGK